MSAASTVTRIIGSSPVAAVARRLDGRLRVLTYHGVPSQPAFRAHAEHLRAHYTVVTIDDVIAASRGVRALPPRAVWITFDDGVPSTIDNGLTVLQETGLTATMFVVASVLGTTEPLWWEVVRAAMAEGLAPPTTETALKRLPDAARRVEVDRLRSELGPRTWRQLGDDDLAAWIAAGNVIGSHTWDHPCLDRCSADDQEEQVRAADAALSRWLGSRRTFAYPNGNWAPGTERALRRLGYDLAVVCDHRLSDLDAPLRISRLRVDADVPIERFRAIVSGAHSTGFRVASAARRVRAGVRR